MPQFLSPGAAAASAIEQFMLDRAEAARQARLDAQQAEKHQFDMKRAQRQLDREDEDRNTKLEDRAMEIEDRARNRYKERIANKVIGDQFSPEEQIQSHVLDVPVRPVIETPSPMLSKPPGIIQELSPDEGRSGETPIATPAVGAVRFGGSPQQAKEEADRTARQKFIEGLQKTPQPASGGTGAAQSAAARAVGLPMSAADFEPPTDRAESATIQEYKFYADAETKAGRTPLGFDAYQERDANRKRAIVQSLGPDASLTPKQMSVATQLANSLKAHPAYADMQDIATGIQGVEVGLSQNNGFGDITAINSMQRMIDPGATVRSEDVKLMQSAAAFLARIAPDYVIDKLKKGDKLPPAVRTQMLEAARQVYTARSKYYNESVGNQYKNLAKAGGVPFELIGQDFPDSLGATAPAAEGGVPVVGGMFQGGKVLKVTPYTGP